ncbi:MAG: phage integrase N-terminal SAM-like domain-containing protein [Planctomycetales bacterium]|nr:phage integrase N-terminal SAM-like domain-containing protein [Planctomycetales bacterium]
MLVRSVENLSGFSSIGSVDVESFLTDLAVDGGVAASTQEQAFYALLFLFQHVLKVDLGNVNALRADNPKLVPTVMSKQEVQKVLPELPGESGIIGQLLYGRSSRGSGTSFSVVGGNVIIV